MIQGRHDSRLGRSRVLVQTLSKLPLLNTHELSSSFRRQLAEAVLSCEMLKGYF